LKRTTHVYSDGRILFSTAASLYIASKDGADPNKLLDAGGFVGEPNLSRDGKLIFTPLQQCLGSPELYRLEPMEPASVFD